VPHVGGSNVLLKRNEREQQPRQLLAGIIRRIGIGPVRKVVLEVVVDSKTGPHRPGSLAGRIPGQAHAWLQQQFGVVLSKTRMADDWIRRDHKVFLKHIVRTAVRNFIPPIGHLVPQAQTQREIRPELHFILEIPGRFERPVAKRNRIPVQVELARGILEKCL